MALGVIFFKAAKGFNQDVYSYLFGSIVALTFRETVAIVALSGVVVAALVVLRKELLYYAFDEEMAAVSGVPVTFLHYFLVTVLAVMIVVSVRMVGIILISAFLILPGATAHLIARRFSGMMGLAILFGLATTLAGMVVSWATDWPTGAAIVVVQFGLFAVLLVGRRLIRA